MIFILQKVAEINIETHFHFYCPFFLFPFCHLFSSLSQPGLIGYVRFMNILTLLGGLSRKNFLLGAVFLVYPFLFWELRDKGHNFDLKATEPF